MIFDTEEILIQSGNKNLNYKKKNSGRWKRVREGRHCYDITVGRMRRCFLQWKSSHRLTGYIIQKAFEDRTRAN